MKLKVFLIGGIFFLCGCTTQEQQQLADQGVTIAKLIYEKGTERGSQLAQDNLSTSSTMSVLVGPPEVSIPYSPQANQDLNNVVREQIKTKGQIGGFFKGLLGTVASATGMGWLATVAASLGTIGGIWRRKQKQISRIKTTTESLVAGIQDVREAAKDKSIGMDEILALVRKAQEVYKVRDDVRSIIKDVKLARGTK